MSHVIREGRNYRGIRLVRPVCNVLFPEWISTSAGRDAAAPGGQVAFGQRADVSVAPTLPNVRAISATPAEIFPAEWANEPWHWPPRTQPEPPADSPLTY